MTVDKDELLSKQQNEVDSKLWAMANNLRGNMDASEFKNYILGLIFYKFLSDKITKTINDELEDDGLTFEKAWKDKSMQDDIRELATNVIGYFLEPILLTAGMLKCGLSLEYITTNYGIISGYIFPILLLPSFFTGAISSSIIPIISNLHVKNDYRGIKRKIKQALFFSLLIGVPVTIFYFLFPEVILKLMYNTTIGSNYLRILSIPFLLYYIELPLSAVMQATNKSKQVFIDNMIGIIIKTILLYLLSIFNFDIYSLIIASSINIIIVTYRHFKNIKKEA